MLISQKTNYALRAVLELAKRHGKGPVKVPEVARAQDIPMRFLEAILNRLRQAGLLKSRRGCDGGYELAKSPSLITVHEVVVLMQGPLALCAPANPGESGSVLNPVWDSAREAMSQALQQTTFEELAERDKVSQKAGPIEYYI